MQRDGSITNLTKTAAGTRDVSLRNRKLPDRGMALNFIAYSLDWAILEHGCCLN
jgi:hypothetical protein